MNNVQLIGELVRPVEVSRGRLTGRTWAKTMIAVPRVGGAGIDLVPVTVYAGEAVMASRYLNVGSLVAVEGRLHSARMAERDEEDRRATRRLVWVIADRVTYLRLARRVEPGDRP
jgi:single-stranded DNA-binding protein